MALNPFPPIPSTDLVISKPVQGLPQDGDTLKFDAINDKWIFVPASGTGTITDGVNIGIGAKVFVGKSGSILGFRSIAKGDGVIITETADTIIIASPFTSILTQSFPRINIPNNQFATFGGAGTFSPISKDRLIVLPRAGSLRKFTVFVDSNTTTGSNAEMALFVNDIPRSPSITFPLSTGIPPVIGSFTDVIAGAPSLQGDTLNIKTTKAGGGELNIIGMSIELL